MFVKQIKIAAAGGALALLLAGSVAAQTEELTDFIDDGSRTNFVTFEFQDPSADGGSGPPLYTEDGVTVEQISGDGNDIWSTYTFWGAVGKNWYPNGGDNGYTKVVKEDGSNFDDVGMLRGSGNGSHTTLNYELWDDGGMVLGDSVSHMVNAQYLGWSGGGFDEIRMRDGPTPGPVTPGSHQALAIDSIELTGAGGGGGGGVDVPASSTLGIAILIGLLGALSAVLMRSMKAA